MKLIEADGKHLLRTAGIETPPGALLPLNMQEWPAEAPWPAPLLVKCQVLQGRRGASGLILRCNTAEEFASVVATLRERLNGTPCAGFLCEPIIKIASEWFISVDVDRAAGELRAAVSVQGGQGVHAADDFYVRDLDAQNIPAEIAIAIRQLAVLMGESDAVHAEINPYAQLQDGSFMALDAKIELDDAAAARHPERATFHMLPALSRALTEREQAYASFLETAGHRGTFGQYLELDGDIALILSGGGASLVALDAMQRAGGRAANYLEVSGNPEPEKLREAARIALAKPGLRGVWVAGSFANFTDIQATCRAVREAMDDLGLTLPVAIRRDGPSASEAEQESLAWAKARGSWLAFHRADTSLETSAAALLAQIV